LTQTHFFQHNDAQHSHRREEQGHQDHHHGHGRVLPQRDQAQYPATAKQQGVARGFPLPPPCTPGWPGPPGPAPRAPEPPVGYADCLQHVHHVLGKEDEEEDKEVERAVTPGREGDGGGEATEKSHPQTFLKAGGPQGEDPRGSAAGI